MPLPVNGWAFYQCPKTYHLCTHTVYFEHYEVTISTGSIQVMRKVDQGVSAKLAGIICGDSFALHSVDPDGYLNIDRRHATGGGHFSPEMVACAQTTACHIDRYKR